LGFSWKFLALAVSLEHLGSVYNNQKHWFYQTLDQATEEVFTKR
jgi:monomeric isocitrate dehydrogenase